MTLPKVRYYIAAKIIEPAPKIRVRRMVSGKSGHYGLSDGMPGSGPSSEFDVSDPNGVPAVGVFDIFGIIIGGGELSNMGFGVTSDDFPEIRWKRVPTKGYVIATVVNNPWTARSIADHLNSLPKGTGFRRK